MKTATITDTMPLEDMSGPLLYWGPAFNAQPAAILSPAERIVLNRLRGRLTNLDASATTLSAALDALLAPRGTLEAVAA